MEVSPDDSKGFQAAVAKYLGQGRPDVLFQVKD